MVMSVDFGVKDQSFNPSHAADWLSDFRQGTSSLQVTFLICIYMLKLCEIKYNDPWKMLRAVPGT